MALKWDDTLVGRVKQAAMIGIVGATEAVKSTAVRKIMTGPKTGRIYRRRSVQHQASAPGEAPATDTGRLAKSGRTEYDYDETKGTVIFSTEYASHLEFEGERPFLRPSLAENAKKAVRFIQAEVAKVLQ